MNKQTFSSAAVCKALTLLMATTVGLSACEAPKPKSDKAADKAGDAAAGTTTSTATTTTTATTTATTTDGANTTPGAAPAAGAPQANQVKSELDDLPQLNAVRETNLSKLKDSVVICTVNGAPITVETFKKEFRDAVVSLQSLLTTQPAKVNQLLNDAKAMNVELTPDERNRLLQTAKQKEALEGKSFTDFLKEKKITEAQFNEQVLMLGLAFKTGTRVIESQLISEIINRQLVLAAAQNSGFDRAAMNKFIAFKHTPKYTEVLKSSNATAEQIKDEVVSHEMIALQMEKIANTASVPDATLREQYDKNKASFKHGERLHLAHIVIAAPESDNPPLKSIRTQVKEQKPNLTNDELDKEVKVMEQHQQQQAAEILARALKGEDFKTLADRYTDDIQARNNKVGGDLGYVDLSVKLPGDGKTKSDQEKLTDAVKNLKVGAVAPELVHTAFGWHIVKLTEKQPAGTLSFEEVKPTLRQLLGNQAKEIAEITWIKDQRKKAQIKVSDEFLKASAEQKAQAAAAGKAPAR